MAKIVVVDDDQVFRQLLMTILQLEGHEAVAVVEPEAIVTTVRRERPALVLMDIHIGNRDTVATLRDLKGDAELGSIPVLMTSGMDRGKECLDAGADGFVLKPFRPSEMLAKIKELTQPAS